MTKLIGTLADAELSAPEAKEIYVMLTVDRHDFMCQVVGTSHAAEGEMPSIVIIRHSESCACGRQEPPSVVTIPADYKV